MKKIDGIYRQIKTTLAKPTTKKRIAWGSLAMLILGIAVYLGIIFSSPNQAIAATSTKTWVDGTGCNGDGNWNTAGNWSPSGVPSNTSDVVLNSTYNCALTLNAVATAASFTVNSGYSQTITVSNNLTTDSSQGGTGSFTLNGGTYSAGSTTLTIVGSFTVGTGTFTKGTSTVVMKGTGNISTGTQQLNNLKVSQVSAGGTNTVYLTSSQTYSLPTSGASAWDGNAYTVAALGPGGAGSAGMAVRAAGGGAYTVNSAVTNGSSITVTIPAGGSGTDTSYGSYVIAKAGQNGSAGGQGGQAASCTPSTGAFSGGNKSTSYRGGGGAAGPNGAGASGSSSNDTGGQGDNGTGGAGGTQSHNGSAGTEWGDGIHGSGGGGGGTSQGAGSGGLYGAGGGGAPLGEPGGPGSGGLIKITYASATVNSTVTTNGNVVVTGTLTTDASQTLSIATGNIITMNTGATTTNNGTISGVGTLELQDTAGANLGTGGTLSSAVKFNTVAANITVPQRTYGGGVEIYNNTSTGYAATLGTATSQTLTFSSNFTTTTASSGALTIQAATYNPVLNFGGNFALSNNTTYTKGTGNIVFNGTTSTTYTDSNATSQNIGAVTITKTNGTPANNKVTLASGMKVNTLTISANNTLDLAASGYTLDLANAGATTTVLTVSGTLTIGTSTIKYSATNSSGDININTLVYSSLKLSGTETYDLQANLTGGNAVTGNLTIDSGAILNTTASNYNLELKSNWSNAGTFTANSGTVTLSGSANQSATTGSSAFYNLTCANTSASPGITFIDGTGASHLFKDVTASSVLTFTAGTTSALNDIQLNGAATGTRIVIRSTAASVANWNVTKAAPQTDVSYVDVSYNDASSGSQIDASNGTNNDGLNNNNWKFISNNPPNSPTTLTQKTSPGGVSIAESAWTNDNTTDLGFTVADPDAGNTVKYELQLATDLGFSSLVLDYTHGTLSASGTTFAFTVGSYGGGTCTGTCPATLSDTTSGYFWRVKGIDNSGAVSSYAEFGVAGTMDFKVDATAPTGGSVTDSANTGSLTQLAATWSGFSDPTSAIAKYEYAIGTTSGGTDIKTWTDNSTSTSVTAMGLNLQTSTPYYFSVRATDTVNNVGTAVNSAGQMVVPTLSFTLGSTSINFDNLNASNSYTDSKSHTIGIVTNASNGYSIYGYTTQVLTSLQYPMKNISNYAGTWTMPTTWSGYGFGYTSSDNLVAGSDRFGGGTKYCAFSQSSLGNIVADHTAAINGSTGSASDSWTITYKVATPVSQEAAKYQTTGIYIVVPNF